jgi:hypothetical protein
MPLERLLLPMQRLARFAMITCANKLAPAVLFSIGWGGYLIGGRSAVYFKPTLRLCDGQGSEKRLPIGHPIRRVFAIWDKAMWYRLQP